MGGTEKRGSERREFRSDLEVILSASGHATGALVQRALSLDISSSGLGVEISTRLGQGEVVQLRMPMTGTDVAMPVFAEVRWSTPANNAWRVGLQFLGQA